MNHSILVQGVSSAYPNRKIFLPGEEIPEGFVEECRKDGKGSLSTHVEGVG